MKVTYIGHSGFLVETDDGLFLFDYYRTETAGGFPALDRTKQLYAFSSHFHSDHYTPEIFAILSDHPKIRYIFSADIQAKQVPAEQIKKVTFVKADNTCKFEEAGGAVVVRTLKSTDSGVAFLVESGGKRFYHAGDLNWWTWDDDTKQEANDMKARFTREIDKLRGISIDAAFLPLDPRQGALFWKGFDYAMRTADIKTAFPMHMWNDFTVIDQLMEMEISAPYRQKIVNLSTGENTYEF